MCINHIDHIVSGRKPLSTFPREYDVVFKGKTWLDVWNWLLTICPEQFDVAEILKDGGNHTPDDIFAATAQCHIVDRSNFYNHIVKDGWIVILGDD